MNYHDGFIEKNDNNFSTKDIKYILMLKRFPETVYLMNGLLNCGKSHVIVILVRGIGRGS